MTAQPDAIVIGAGHNGLVAANVLADVGWRVLVLEATDAIGGAVRSTSPAPGVTMDLFSAFHPLGFVSPALRRLNLADHGLRWSRAPLPLGHVFPDGTTAVIDPDPQVTAAQFDAVAPGDGARWLAVLDEWHQLRDGVIRSLLGPWPPVSGAAGLVLTTPPSLLARTVRVALASARSFVEATWQGEGPRTLVTGSALHADVSPEASGSALFGWLLTMLAQDVGFPVPQGGAGALSAALAARLQARGGQIRTSAPVTAIRTGAGRAIGVTVAGDEDLDCARAVLADVPAPALYRDMLRPTDLPAGFLAELESFAWDNPTLKVNWVRSSPVPWRDPLAARCGTLHLGADRDGITTWNTDLTLRRTPQQPFLVAGQMTLADPSRSPKGTETLWAYTHLPHTDDAGAMRDAVSNTVAAIEATFADLAPGFADGVAMRIVQAPADLQRENPSLVGGAVNGGTAQLQQQTIFRPALGPGGPATPVSGLYLASSSTHPGGGVHGACGNNAAVAALRAHRPIRGLVRRGVDRAAWRVLYR